MAADIADFLDPLGLGSAIAAQFEKEGSPERSEQRPPAAALRCVQTAANACQRLPSPPPHAVCTGSKMQGADLERRILPPLDLSFRDKASISITLTLMEGGQWTCTILATLVMLRLNHCVGGGWPTPQSCYGGYYAPH